MSNLRHFDLNLLVIFEALVSESHVSRAAEKVFLSQSATSHALNRLRQQLDDPVLVRTEHGLQPTPRALAMLDDVRQALAGIEQVLEPPGAFDPAQSSRTFRLACTDYFECVLFPDWFASINQRYPGLGVEIFPIAEDTHRNQLSEGQIDFIVGLESNQVQPGHLLVKPWLKESYSCLVAHENPLVGDELTLDQYLALNHLTVWDVARDASSGIEQWLQRQGVSRTIIARTLNHVAAARIVASSDAVLTLPRRLAELYSQMLPLRQVRPPREMPDISLTLIQHPRYQADPALAWLGEEILRSGSAT